MKVSFPCPVCDQPARLPRVEARDWRCPACDQFVQLHPVDPEQPLACCVICGDREFYKKKDFPHWLGLTVLAVACLGTIIPYALYHQWLSWTILIGSALFDGLLYLWVGDVVVCYRCAAHYRDLPPGEDYRPYELGIGERYRQERLRREELARKPGG